MNKIELSFIHMIVFVYFESFILPSFIFIKCLFLSSSWLFYSEVEEQSADGLAALGTRARRGPHLNRTRLAINFNGPLH